MVREIGGEGPSLSKAAGTSIGAPSPSKAGVLVSLTFPNSLRKPVGIAEYSLQLNSLILSHSRSSIGVPTPSAFRGIGFLSAVASRELTLLELPLLFSLWESYHGPF